MKNIYIPSENRYKASHDWLESYHIFSFAEYFDPQNMHFGNMRVFNDDVIDAQRGFGMHPHDNMEILTIVLSGEISHADSIGNAGVTRSGELQTMTAGSGVLHSEKNEGNTPVHLYQIWFLPRERNLTPTYQNHTLTLSENSLSLLVSGESSDGVGYLNSDIKVYRGIFDAGKSFKYEITSGKGLFLYLTSGKLTVGDDILEPGDQIRYGEPGSYNFEVIKAADFILIETSLVSA